MFRCLTKSRDAWGKCDAGAAAADLGVAELHVADPLGIVPDVGAVLADASVVLDGGEVGVLRDAEGHTAVLLCSSDLSALWIFFGEALGLALDGL